LCEGRAWWRLIALPAAWTALEFARSHLLSGFGWNLLAYSQVPHGLWLAQSADLFGAWGVSFLLVLLNVAICDAIAAAASSRRAAVASVSIALVVLVAAAVYARLRLGRPAGSERVRIAVVQGNIPQQEKWDEAFTQSILERYTALTREAAKANPALIIWPETATPGYFGLEEEITQPVLQASAAAGRPLLVGAPMGRLEDFEWKVTNSAAFVDPAGTIAARYDKLHLVPFGEFVPFDKTLPWLRHLLPPIGNFVAGRDWIVFRQDMLGRPQPLPEVPPAERGLTDFLAEKPRKAAPMPPAPPFAVLICFEDVFPELARRFVGLGAQWLIVITNDAWFGPTAAAYQHAQASTFRAIELRVPVARAANTGWSGCIDAAGRWQERVRTDDGQELFVSGIAGCELAIGAGRSAYQRYGDWFAWLCVGLVLLTVVFRGRRPRLL
jgi:apolipoprotein N-acyltransferase